jgi:hypothetical protein
MPFAEELAPCFHERGSGRTCCRRVLVLLAAPEDLILDRLIEIPIPEIGARAYLLVEDWLKLPLGPAVCCCSLRYARG